MALELYLDDCADAGMLAYLLCQAGHTVVRPRDAGTTGAKDPVHLGYAAGHGLILITTNPGDFLALHAQSPNHSGIFGIYQDNDVTKDMTEADIVAAIERVEQAVPLGYPLAGEFHVLNDWR